MSNLSHIFQKPIVVDSVGEIYPVLLKNYDEFIEKANVLVFNYGHFNLDEIAKMFNTYKENIKLLDLIVLAAKQTNAEEQTYQNLQDIFSIVLRKKIKYNITDNGLFFNSDDKYLIDRFNYDEIRKVVMEQNLIFEQKVFKNKLTAKWAEKVLNARAKNTINMTIEDMVTTVSVYTGKNYSDLEYYSYYQLKADFNRIMKIKNYETMSIAMANPYAGNIKLDHFAENIEMFKNPYDDIFVSDNKLSDIKSALGGR